LVKIASAKGNGNQFTDFSANENGFGCIQNHAQSLDKCKQISQFIAHENGFGCVQNQTYRKMQINLPILALMKMVLDTSKTNP
jgi:hypothetical protein